MRWLLALAMLAIPSASPGQPAPRPVPSVENAPTVELPRSVRPTARVTPPDARNGSARSRDTDAAAPGDGSLADVVQSSRRPAFRPADIVPAASRTPRQSRGGACGRNSIVGTRIAPVTGAGACGIRDAVRITATGGVALSRPTRMTCATARALDDWVRTGVLPTVGRSGGGVVALQVAAGYSCRTRNSQSGAKISEHAKGNAIDISAIALANGDRLTVLSDWGRGAKGRMLRTLWQRACGPFGTVLGPEADRFHRDHFHFDVAAYRSGSYCR